MSCNNCFYNKKCPNAVFGKECEDFIDKKQVVKLPVLPNTKAYKVRGGDVIEGTIATVSTNLCGFYVRFYGDSPESYGYLWGETAFATKEEAREVALLEILTKTRKWEEKENV